MKSCIFTIAAATVVNLVSLASALAADHEGTFNLANLTVGGVRVERATCKYSLDVFVNEPLVNGVFRYEAAANLHYSTKMFVTCQSVDSTHPQKYFVVIDCPVGEPGKDPGSNVAGSPNWGQLFLTERSYGSRQFLSADQARNFWKQGFNVVEATLLADPSAASTGAASPSGGGPATSDGRTPSRPNPFAQAVTSHAEAPPVAGHPAPIMNHIEVRPPAVDNPASASSRNSTPAPNPFSRLSAPPANSSLNPQARAPEVRENPFKRANSQAAPNPSAVAPSASTASRPSHPTQSAPEKTATASVPASENPFASTQRLAREKADQDRQAQAAREEEFRESLRQQNAQAERARQQAQASFNAREEARRAEVKQKADGMAAEFGRQRDQVNQTFDNFEKKNNELFDKMAQSRNESAARSREREEERRQQEEAEARRAEEAKQLRQQYADDQDRLREIEKQRESQRQAEEERENRRREQEQATREADQRAAALRDSIQQMERQNEEMRRANERQLQQLKDSTRRK